MFKSLFAFFLLILFYSCKPKPNSPNILITAMGEIDRIENFDSKYIASRNIDVWLPESYTPDEKYAVLYMHDGQMLYDSTTTWNKQEWGVDEKMSELMQNNSIRKTIVVGIWNTKDRHAEYFPQKPFESLPIAFQDSLIHDSNRNAETALFSTTVKSDDYLKFLVLELKPFVDKKYSTLPERKNTFIMGSSMGGLISMYAICEYPEIFGGAACLSTHWLGTFTADNNPIPNSFSEYLMEHLPDPQKHKIYFDYGTETLDALYEPFQLQVDSVMSLKGFKNENWVTLKFLGDDHSERTWRKRLEIPLKFLLGTN